jgi:hypothetical protein
VTFFATNGSSEKSKGCGPQPTLEIQPFGRITSNAFFSEALTPAASTTPSAPKPSTDFAQVVASPIITSAPYCFAISNLFLSSSSPTHATSAPASFAIAAHKTPIGPGP